MKLVVPVKAVAVLDDEFELDEDAKVVDPDDLEWELNEWDAFSLEAALQLRDEAGGGEVVVVTVGDDGAEDALLGCLAKGADRATQVWDANLRDADPLGVARVLAAAIETESPDLVLCGVQSSDAVNGATGIAIAGYLDLAHVAVVKGIRLGEGRVEVVRELEGGLAEAVSVELPALLTVQTGINEPRYATLRAIKQAREKPLAGRSPGDLGVDDAELASVAGSVRRGLAPIEAGRAEMLQGGPAEVADRLAAIIKDRLG